MKKLLLASAIILAVSSFKAQSFLQEFDDSTAAKTQGWQWMNNSKVKDPSFTPWYLSSTGTSPVTAWSGTNCFQTSFEACASINANDTASTWLIAPMRMLNNGDMIIFKTTKEGGSSSFPDNMQVRLSTSASSVVVGGQANSTAPFTTLLLNINPGLTAIGYPTSWTGFGLTLSGLPASGVNGRFAFRYYVPDLNANGTYVDIDSVAYVTFSTVGIRAMTLAHNYRITPNPTNGPLKIYFPTGSESREIVIQNMPGDVVFRAAITETENHLDLSTLQKGVYIMNIKDGNRFATEKITIQ